MTLDHEYNIICCFHPSKRFRFRFLKYCLFMLKYSQPRVYRQDLTRVSKNNIVLIKILSDLNKMQKLQP